MFGVLVNSLAIIAGTLIGLLFKKFIPKHISPAIFEALGLAVIVIGLQGALKTENPLLMVASLSIGTFLGTLIDIDKHMNNAGDKLENLISKGESKSPISKAFVSSTILFCSGAMAVIGSLEAGIRANYEILYIKSLLDGIASIFFALTLGIGVIFSSVTTFIYQGAITLSANLVNPFITDAMILELGAVGSVMILAIGTNMIGASKIKISNLLPGLLIPVVYHLFV